MYIRNEQQIRSLRDARRAAGAYWFCGADPTLNDFYATGLARSVTDIDNAAFDYSVFNGNEMRWEDFYEACESLPVCGGKVCVVVRDLDLVKLKKDDREPLMAYLRTMPATTVILIVWTGVKVDRSQSGYFEKLKKDFADVGTVVELGQRGEQELVRMMVAGAKKRGTTISEQDAAYLQGLVGRDIANLMNEFDKICAYADGRPVTREMIDRLAVPDVQEQVFALARHINRGQGDAALLVLRQMLERKAAPHMIAAIMNGDYVDAYRLKLSQLAGKRPDDVIKAFGYDKTGKKDDSEESQAEDAVGAIGSDGAQKSGGKAFRLTKPEQAPYVTRRFSLDQIKRMIRICAETDRLLKSSGSLDAQTEVTLCVLRLLQVTRG